MYRRLSRSILTYTNPSRVFWAIDVGRYCVSTRPRARWIDRSVRAKKPDSQRDTDWFWPREDHRRRRYVSRGNHDQCQARTVHHADIVNRIYIVQTSWWVALRQWRDHRLWRCRAVRFILRSRLVTQRCYWHPRYDPLVERVGMSCWSQVWNKHHCRVNSQPSLVFCRSLHFLEHSARWCAVCSLHRLSLPSGDSYSHSCFTSHFLTLYFKFPYCALVDFATV